MKVSRTGPIAVAIALFFGITSLLDGVRAAETKTVTPASPASKTVVVVGEGKAAGGVVDGARKAIPVGWDARPANELKLAGTTTALWVALDKPKLRAGALAKIRAALASNELDAALFVQVVVTKKSRVVHVLLVVSGEDDVALDEKLTLPLKPGPQDDEALRAILVVPLEQRAPRPEVATPLEEPDEYAAKNEATSKPGADVPTAPEPGATPPREPMLVVGAMGELAARRFTYDGTTIGGLRPYNLPNVAAIGVSLEVYPLRDTPGLVSGLGVAGDFHTSIGLKSTAVGTTEQSTGSWTRFDGMLRWWVPLTASHRTALGLSAGYGQERFAFSPKAPDLPSVRYEYARAGVDFRLRLGRGDTSRGAAVFVGSGYLLVFSGGDVSDHFRRVTTWGLELSGGLSVHLSAAIEARLAVDYRRYKARFGGAQLGDPYIASGALDEMVRTLVELRVKY